jgi:hypothetical protein
VGAGQGSRGGRRLVDSEEQQLAGGGHRAQLGEQAARQLLGRRVYEEELAGDRPLLDRRVDLRRAEQYGDLPPAAPHRVVQPRHLVVHQRDERRDHHDGLAAHQRRKLVADRLATAGRPEYGRVAAGQRRRHDVFLVGPEAVVPEVLEERLLQRGAVGGRRRSS